MRNIIPLFFTQSELALRLLLPYCFPGPPKAPRRGPKAPRRGPKYPYVHQGQQEITRRCRQIKAGTLKVSS